MRVADRCQEREGFIVHLLKLGVPGLFSVLSPNDKPAVSEFEDGLRRFIRENIPKSNLISQTKEIMVIYIFTCTYSTCLLNIFFSQCSIPF